MRYLKCTKCGFANEVKTPYMVFCGKCNKKMVNNFPDWQVRYPNKSFADFMSTECIDKPDNTAIGEHKKPCFAYYFNYTGAYYHGSGCYSLL